MPNANPGNQRPRILSVPKYESSAGKEACDLARLAGLDLDPWQRFILDHALGEQDGKLAAFEVGLVCPRQNGKGGLLEARELAGLFLLGEELIIHSAHEFSTSRDHLRRLLALIEGTPEFDRRVMRVSRSHGDEGIELRTGQRILFRTRTKAGGRGYSADCVVLDEAMDLPRAAIASLLPTMAARPSAQIWYTGSAVDRQVHPNGRVLARVRERGMAGDDPALLFAEWSIPQTLDQVVDAVAQDPENWARANPALGIRISTDYLERESRAMDPRGFAVERLGVGDWPIEEMEGERVIDPDAWAKCVDMRSNIDGTPCFGLDIPRDRTTCAIASAGKRSDGLPHVEVVEYRRGIAWVVDRVAALVKKHDGLVVLDDKSPAASLVPELERAKVDVVTMGTKEVVTATANFFDAVNANSLRIYETEELANAAATAARRSVGDAWCWSRSASVNDATPLVAATLALWGLQHQKRATPEAHDLGEVIARMAAEGRLPEHLSASAAAFIPNQRKEATRK